MLPLDQKMSLGKPEPMDFSPRSQSPNPDFAAEKAKQELEKESALAK